MKNKRKKIILSILIIGVIAFAGLGTLRTVSDTIKLRKIRLYIYSIDIYGPFKSGNYELLLKIKFRRHFGTFGGHFIDNDNQYGKTSSYFESCETFRGGFKGIELCHEYFDYSYCVPLGEANNIVEVTFWVKKNWYSHQDISWGLGSWNYEYGVYYEKSLYFSKFQGALTVRYMFLVV